MGKKKAKAGIASGAGSDTKSRVELRLDADVAKGIQELAEKTGVSVNQLMNAIGAWMIRHGHPAMEPKLIEGKPGIVNEKQQEGVIWFGRISSQDEGAATDPETGERYEGYYPRNDGAVFGVLDFTVRRVLRED